MTITTATKERFERVAWPRAVRAARIAFGHWPERKREDAEAEFMAKMWDQWARLAARGKDPEPLLYPMLYWAKQWEYQDRRLSGRPRQIGIEDYRAGMTRHLMDSRGRLAPHDRSARINRSLDWDMAAPVDDPAAWVAALDAAGLSLADFCD